MNYIQRSVDEAETEEGGAIRGSEEGRSHANINDCILVQLVSSVNSVMFAPKLVEELLQKSDIISNSYFHDLF